MIYILIAPQFLLLEKQPNVIQSYCSAKVIYDPIRARIINLVYLTATESGGETTTAEPVTYAPEDALYKITTDYHWPTFNLNATHTEGDWTPGQGLGYGPFGFGTSVKFGPKTVSI